MTLTLELDKGVYHLKENGKTLITLHYGYSGHDPPEEQAKRLNVLIDPRMWGGTKRISEAHMHYSGHIIIGLDEVKGEVQDVTPDPGAWEELVNMEEKVEG